MYIIYITLTPPSGPRVSHLVCTTHNISITYMGMHMHMRRGRGDISVVTPVGLTCAYAACGPHMHMLIHLCHTCVDLYTCACICVLCASPVHTVRSSYALVVTSVSCVLSYARGCCPVVCVRSRCRDKVGFIIVLHLNNSMTASQQPHDSFTTACACGLG